VTDSRVVAVAAKWAAEFESRSGLRLDDFQRGDLRDVIRFAVDDYLRVAPAAESNGRKRIADAVIEEGAKLGRFTSRQMIDRLRKHYNWRSVQATISDLANRRKILRVVGPAEEGRGWFYEVAV
jgi:hypothetical protein